jgi:1-phosphofructokinase family hexose kinase
MTLSTKVQKSDQPLVVTVTPNPMLDKTIEIESLELGTIMRASSLKSIAGGKGINVARVLRSLGVDTLATGFLGGRVGEAILDLLAREGIPADFVQIRGTTREGFTFIDKSSGVPTAIFEPAHQVQPLEARRLIDKFTWLAGRSHWACLSGSMPCPGLEDLCADMIRQAKQLGVRTVLDTYDTPFLHGVEAGPFMVKPNLDEIRRTFRRPFDSDEEVFDLAAEFHEKGVEWVVVSNGIHPLLVSVNGQRWRAFSLDVPTVNPVGSGDAMVAGFIYAFIQGFSPEECIRHGVAAGAANARVWDAGSCTLDDLDELVPQVKLEKL